MEGQSGLSELSVISWVSAFEGCPLGGVPLYTQLSWNAFILNLFPCSGQQIDEQQIDEQHSFVLVFVLSSLCVHGGCDVPIGCLLQLHCTSNILLYMNWYHVLLYLRHQYLCQDSCVIE